MADVDAQFAAGGGNALCVEVVAKRGQEADVHTEQAQIVRDVPADTAQARRDPAGVGILRDHGGKGAAADVHVHAAGNDRVGPGAQDVALARNVTLLHQIGNVHRDGGARNPRAFRQCLLRDHRIRFDPLQKLPFPLCHGITA